MFSKYCHSVFLEILKYGPGRCDVDAQELVTIKEYKYRVSRKLICGPC